MTTIDKIIKIQIISVILLLIFNSFLYAQEDADMNTAKNLLDYFTDEGSLDLSFTGHDKVEIIGSGFTMGRRLSGDKLLFNINFPFIKLIRQKQYEDKFHFTGDLAAYAAVGLPLYLFGTAFGDSSKVPYYIMAPLSPLLLPLIHPSLSFRPVRPVLLNIGYDSEYRLFCHEDGIFFRPQAGIEFWHYAGLEVGAEYITFWSFDKDSRSIGWAWHIKLKLYPAYIEH